MKRSFLIDQNVTKQVSPVKSKKIINFSFQGKIFDVKFFVESKFIVRLEKNASHALKNRKKLLKMSKK